MFNLFTTRMFRQVLSSANKEIPIKLKESKSTLTFGKSLLFEKLTDLRRSCRAQIWLKGYNSKSIIYDIINGSRLVFIPEIGLRKVFGWKPSIRE